MSLFAKGLLCGLLVGVLEGRGAAQTGLEAGQVWPTLKGRMATPEVLPAASVPQGSLEDELYRMSAQAAVIFAGEVLAVRPQGNAGGDFVEIEFRVAKAIRGCRGQDTYTLREWAGLWTGGVQRYRVGQQLLMLLHAPSEGGLSSPVGGQDGAIPITGSGASPTPEDNFTRLGEQAVDLRWIKARLLRVDESHEHQASAETLLVTRERTVTTMRGAVRAKSVADTSTGDPVSGSAEEPTSAATAGVLVQRSTLRLVLAMLGSWEAQQAYAGR